MEPPPKACTSSIHGGRESNTDGLHCSQIKQKQRKISQAGNGKLHSQTNCTWGSYIISNVIFNSFLMCAAMENLTVRLHQDRKQSSW